MAQTKRPSPSARRAPRQQRSVQAVEAIFEATGQLIESQGLETLTTARIAEDAVAAGSLRTGNPAPSGPEWLRVTPYS